MENTNNDKIKDVKEKLAALMKKNKGMTAATAALLVLMFALPMIKNSGNGPKAPSVLINAPGPEDTMMMDSTLKTKYEEARNPLGASIQQEAEQAPAIPIIPEGYPQPSFVTSGEDTLVWKEMVYKRIGTLEKLYGPKDTIEFEGNKYIRENVVIENLNKTLKQIETENDTTQTQPIQQPET